MKDVAIIVIFKNLYFNMREFLKCKYLILKNGVAFFLASSDSVLFDCSLRLKL
jgi:hypothetical protein